MLDNFLTGGGNIVVDGIYDMAGCDIGFPLNDDIPLNVHSNQVLSLASNEITRNRLSRTPFSLCFFNLIFGIDYCCMIFFQSKRKAWYACMCLCVRV